MRLLLFVSHQIQPSCRTLTLWPLPSRFRTCKALTGSPPVFPISSARRVSWWAVAMLELCLVSVPRVCPFTRTIFWHHSSPEGLLAYIYTYVRTYIHTYILVRFALRTPCIIERLYIILYISLSLFFASPAINPSTLPLPWLSKP